MSSQSILHRRKLLTQAAQSLSADLIIIGGGIHGCAAAREAALQGLSVILFEAEDIASGTSSRSSKMLHGGIRYLEQGDISLVFEALRERAVLLKIASPFARAQRFLFPVISGQTKPAWQIRLGLMLYDLLARIGYNDNPLMGYTELDPDTFEATGLREQGLSFSQLFSYRDAQMDDARICLEMALDARELGVTVLNHTVVTALHGQIGDKQWVVQWRSNFPSQEGESHCSVVLDLRGPELSPWDETSNLVTETTHNAVPSMVLSRGSHLLFNIPWKLPGVALPTGSPGRYYFVWPYFNSYGEYTLVGTTDVYRPVELHDPMASEQEVEELLGYLGRDLPQSGLTKKSLYQSYCGVRSLVRSRRAGLDYQSFPRTSRKHRWHVGERYVGLVGGKYTSARHTAAQGVRHVLGLLGRTPAVPWSESMNRVLPGARGWSDDVATGLTKELAKRFGASEADAGAVVRRRGISAEKLVPLDKRGNSLLLSDVMLSIQDEFAVTVEDIMRRRLNLSLIPGSGIDFLPTIAAALTSAGRSEEEITEEIQQYRLRWKPITL